MTSVSKPILITGSHRSGSTWAGKSLALAPGTAYIHEPFNFEIEIGRTRGVFDKWFQYICEENSGDFVAELDDVISFNYPLASNIRKARSVRMLAKLARDQFLNSFYKRSHSIPIIKDPIALFSSPWLARTYDMNVLIMIRHPAAFCSSIKMKGWTFDFNNFLNQPLLMKDILEPFKTDITDNAKTTKDTIEQAILLWNCMHHAIGKFKKSNPDWVFARHEDLSKQPIEGFKSIYDTFGLEFTDKCSLKIMNSSGAHNPSERGARNEFRRDSVANITNWKTRLTDFEIQRIKVGTKPISDMFYSENDW